MNVNSSTTSHWLHKSTSLLEQHNIATSRLDCLVLLEDSTGKDRGWLLAHPDFEITDTSELDRNIERRSKHEPLAYIRGKSEFYGREFIVDKNTLEPRPETEAIIELVKTIVKGRENLKIVDIGTGSGCIAISVKLEVPNVKIIATDTDVKTLKIARENSKKLGATIEFYQGNLLDAITENVDVILCNLPYVPNAYEINEAATFEPKHAIFGGEDGLDFYRELFKQVSARSNKPEYILTESLLIQHDELGSIAQKAHYALEKTDDFIQLFKFAELPRA